jgi:hypothetical protein
MPTDTKPATPTLDRMHADFPCDGKMVTHSTLIGSFLDWMSANGIHLAKYESVDAIYRDEQLVPITDGPNALLHEFFGVDARIEEAEKMSLLEWIRMAQP